MEHSGKVPRIKLFIRAQICRSVEGNKIDSLSVKCFDTTVTVDFEILRGGLSYRQTNKLAPRGGKDPKIKEAARGAMLAVERQCLK